MKSLKRVLFLLVCVLMVIFTACFSYAEVLKVTQEQETGSFTYKDTDSGITFTLPDYWKEEPLSKNRDYVDVQFISTKNGMSVISYSSTDMWEEMSAADRAGYTRSELNNRAITKSDIATMYGIAADKVSLVRYNGVEYYQLEVPVYSELYNITVVMTQVAHISNGWMYMFQINGTSESEDFADFQKLLSSVRYPGSLSVSDIGSIKQVEKTSSANKVGSRTDDNAVTTGFLISIISIVAIVLVFAFSRYFNKRNTKRDFSQSSECKKNEDITNSLNCVKCGQELPSDSEFCHICGTRIIKE